MRCKICLGENLEEIYNDKIRSGTFGKLTNKSHSILKCEKCDVVFLNKELDSEYYESEDYREDYNDEASIDQYQLLQDKLETNKIYKIGLHNFRDKKVADFGCGGGSFLDGIHGFAKKTIAIEPTQSFHSHLSKKHTVYSYGDELVNNGEKIDIATSFDVIEHVSDPLNYLSEIYKSLNVGGEFYIKTPNHKEILHDLLADEYAKFDYRTAHLFYFNKKSMTYMLKKIGFSVINIKYEHCMDIANMLLWLRDRVPTGNGSNNLFDAEFNMIYKHYLERVGKASHLFVYVKK